MWRFIGLLSLSLAVVFADFGSAAFAKGSPTVFHTSGPAGGSLQAAPVSLLSGCGRGRYRDANTHQCRGPADFSH